GLHAIVADAMTRGSRHGIVHADHRERANGPAFRAQLVELGDLLLERAAREAHAERRFLVRVRGGRALRGLLFEQAARARVLALLVTPDAVMRLVEAADQIRARIGERKAFPPAQRVSF